MALRAGVVLIVASFALLLLIPLVPVVGLRGLAAAGAIGGVVVACEVMFWLGVLLAGRDTWKVVRAHGWRRVPGALWQLLRHPDRTGSPPPSR